MNLDSINTSQICRSAQTRVSLGYARVVGGPALLSGDSGGESLFLCPSQLLDLLSLAHGSLQHVQS